MRLWSAVVALVALGSLPVRGEEIPYRATVDYDQSLSQMITAGKYDAVTPFIGRYDRKFSRDTWPTGKRVREFILLHSDERLTTSQALKQMDNWNLRPATLPELAAFGAAYPDRQRSCHVIALGSWRTLSDGQKSPYLSTHLGERHLSLGERDDGYGGWYAPSCFLAVSASDFDIDPMVWELLSRHVPRYVTVEIPPGYDHKASEYPIVIMFPGMNIFSREGTIEEIVKHRRRR